ncbi:unnamed protein product [Schistosoma turkestanicum]|nr:unnamed protein product [Schistosoma turkestanicum]
MDMEQTKKTEIGFGRLYFWIWVEEYRSEESKSRSAKGSILSLSSLHLHKDKHSTPNPLNYGGSVLSLSSTNDEYKKKKRWYKKIASHHAVHTPGAIPQSHSPVHSMLNITKPMNNGYNPFDYSQQNLNDDDGVIEEKDGSVLGAYSELTANSLSSSSAFAINQLKRPNSMHSSKRNGSMVSSVDLNMKDSNEQLKTKPELMRIAPKCGPSSGGTEMTIYCRFLTPEMMKQSTVFVDDHPVPQDDWFLFESSQPDLSQLRIHMPSLQPGRYSIYIDSAEFGRIRCNQEFTYLQSNGSVIQSSASNLSVSSMNESTHKIINVSPKVNTSTDESSDHGIVFHRMGSQKSNLILVDRRSNSGGGRHREHSRPEALGRSDSLDDTHQSNDTTTTKSETINDHDPIIDPTTSNRHTNRIINYHMNDSNKELSSSGKLYTTTTNTTTNPIVNDNLMNTKNHKSIIVDMPNYIQSSSPVHSHDAEHHSELKLPDRHDDHNHCHVDDDDDEDDDGDTDHQHHHRHHHHPCVSVINVTNKEAVKELNNSYSINNQKSTSLSSVVILDNDNDGDQVDEQENFVKNHKVVSLLEKAENKKESNEKTSPEFPEHISPFNPISAVSIDHDDRVPPSSPSPSPSSTSSSDSVSCDEKTHCNQPINSCLNYSIRTNSNILSKIPEESTNHTEVNYSCETVNGKVDYNKNVSQIDNWIEEKPSNQTALNIESSVDETYLSWIKQQHPSSPYLHHQHHHDYCYDRNVCDACDLSNSPTLITSSSLLLFPSHGHGHSDCENFHPVRLHNDDHSDDDAMIISTETIADIDYLKNTCSVNYQHPHQSPQHHHYQQQPPLQQQQHTTMMEASSLHNNKCKCTNSPPVSCIVHRDAQPVRVKLFTGLLNWIRLLFKNISQLSFSVLLPSLFRK